MPLMKCSGCHHEWEAARTMIDAPCDWCGEPGIIIKEQTEFEAMLANDGLRRIVESVAKKKRT